MAHACFLHISEAQAAMKTSAAVKYFSRLPSGGHVSYSTFNLFRV